MHIRMESQVHGKPTKSGKLRNTLITICLPSMNACIKVIEEQNY